MTFPSQVNGSVRIRYVKEMKLSESAWCWPTATPSAAFGVWCRTGPKHCVCPTSLRHHVLRSASLLFESLLTAASRRHILLSMAWTQSTPPPCRPGSPLRVRHRRTWPAGKILTLSAQVLETMSTMPLRAHRGPITVDSASPVLFNTLLSIPQCLKPATRAPSFWV